jgi:predicted nucleic acid-binding protein
MRSDVFFDSNVLLYSVSGDLVKADRAEELLTAGGCVTVQVLNECTSVLRRKLNAEWSDIWHFSENIRTSCTVFPVTTDIHIRGLSIAERYKFRIHDSMLVAAALLLGCTTMYSEDMHNGMVIDGLTIRNPFAAQPFQR